MNVATTSRAFDLLRRHDPISPADWQRLNELAASRARGVVTGLVVQRFEANRPVWRPRPRRLARMAVALLLLLLLAVPLAATALGVRLPVVDFLGAEKAPSVAFANFESLSVGAPVGMDPAALSGETRELVLTSASGEKRTLWLAPTEAGGFCYLWAGIGGAGGCDRLGTVPLDVVWWSGSAVVGDGAGAQEIDAIAVHASARYVARVELRFTDGTVSAPVVTWVSAPIDHGFLFYGLTSDARAGRHLASVVALDEHRAVVAEVRPCCVDQDAAPPLDAIVGEKQAATSISTTAGDAVIWEAPTRYEGVCAWFEYQGRTASLGRCAAKGYGADHGIALRPYATHERVLVFGRAAPRFGEFDVRYADGVTRRVPVRRGYVLFEIPTLHLRPESRLLTMTPRDVGGRTIPAATFAFPATGTAEAPCWRVLPLQRGDSC
jgi:hypothetical protein